VLLERTDERLGELRVDLPHAEALKVDEERD
jgi:hypothetical protein